MMFWRILWSVIWFGGIGVFTALSLLILIYGYRDLVDLFKTLKKQHEQSKNGSE